MRNIIIILTIIINVTSCKSQVVTYKDSIPEHDSLTITSTHVNEDRIINIWTPPNYKTSSEIFPVLYMPDGGIKEDFPHIANTLAELLEENKIPAFILVGIENTERGRDLTGSSEVEDDKNYCPIADGAKDFRSFITEELTPIIDKTYRTKSKKGIIGESLAGLFVIETFFTAPESFDFYIAMDPSLWWNDNFLGKNAETFLSNLPEKDLKLWFAGSGAEGMSNYTKVVEKALLSNAPTQLNWQYSDEPNEKHSTIYRATKNKALIWTLNN